MPFTSFPIPTVPFINVLYAPPNVVSSGGIFSLPANNYGDVVVQTTAAVNIQLPDSRLRSGFPVRVADTSGGPNVTITTLAGQPFLGMTNIPLTTPYGSFTLWPLTATGGWYGG
jgi:hypothetical protein